MFEILSEPRIIIWKKIGRPQVPDDLYQRLRFPVFQFWGRFSKGFYHIWDCLPTLLKTETTGTNFCSSVPRTKTVDEATTDNLPYLSFKFPESLQIWRAKTIPCLNFTMHFTFTKAKKKKKKKLTVWALFIFLGSQLPSPINVFFKSFFYASQNKTAKTLL